MAGTVAEQTTAALESLRRALTTYAAARAPQRYVGQFIDDEGRAATQYGVYGMGSWVALAEDETIRDQPAVRTLTSDCRAELRRLVQAAINGSTDPKAAVLRSVVPKICYAYLGLGRVPECQPEANLLASWIAAAQRPGGGWGYLTSSPAGCPEMTSLVIRHFAGEPTLCTQIKDGDGFLRAQYHSVSNPFLRLYALNTLLLYDLEAGPALKKTVKETIARLLNQAFFNPTQFPNPINLDFNDGSKTRYIRIPTDMVLLESLELISGARGIYA